MLRNFNDQPCSERVIVALDCPHQQALNLARQLAGYASWVKVGMTLYYEAGPAIVKELKTLGFKVFLDLKMHDIPHQVEGGALSAAQTGADMLTFHCLGGKAMLEAACRGLDKAHELDANISCASLGITVLTSHSQADLEQIGLTGSVSTRVSALAQLACNAGLTGVVASPFEAQQLRSELGEEAFIVTPGIRLHAANNDDQKRIATPRMAFEAGASHIVVGRPITQAENPVSAFKNICVDI